MQDRNNIIAGWVLAGGIAALGLGILSSKYFQADKPHAPHEPGYVIEGVVSGEGAASAVPLATLLAAADVAAGEKQFAKCAACHTIVPGGANGIGPNLHGVMGEAIGTGHGGFAFSAALAGKGGSWTWENMDAWLTSPRKFADGTKMTFAGIGNAEDRAALLLYLNSQGSNLPLPPPPAEGAAPAEGEAPADGATPAAESDAAPAESATPPATDAAAPAAPAPVAK